MILACIGNDYNITAVKACLLFNQNKSSISKYAFFNHLDGRYDGLEVSDDGSCKKLISSDPPDYVGNHAIIYSKTDSYYTHGISNTVFSNECERSLIFHQEGVISNINSLSDATSLYDFKRSSIMIGNGEEESLFTKGRGSFTSAWIYEDSPHKLFLCSLTRKTITLSDNPLWFVEVGKNSFYISTDFNVLSLVPYLLEDTYPKKQPVKLQDNTIICFEYDKPPYKIRKVKRWQEEENEEKIY